MEELDVLFSVGVLLRDVGDWDRVVMVNFVFDMSVLDRLHMMLQVMNMTVMVSFTLDLFNLLMTMSGMSHSLEMLVIVRGVLASGVKLVVSSIIMAKCVMASELACDAFTSS